MTCFRKRYSEQFQDPQYIGTSIPPGWNHVVERALERVRDALTPEEMAAFQWVQIKEKFGRLCMYWNSAVVSVSLISEDGVRRVAIDTSVEDDQTDDDSEESEDIKVASEDGKRMLAVLREKVDAIVQVAEIEARRTCQCCGEPGRLYYGGCWATLCDEHAEEREFPPVYGKWLDAHDHQRIGKDRISERVMYFRGVALFSWRLSDAGPEDFVPVEDMPEWLSDLARGVDVPVATFLGKPAYIADDIARVVDAHSNDLRSQTEMSLPKGARINPEQGFRYKIARATGVRRPKIEHMVDALVGDLAIAGVRMADGEFRVFKQEGIAVSEVTYCPEDFLERRVEVLEGQAAALRAMLREVQQD
ncbi:MAG: hypothetical protein JNK71_00830 [Methyloversatilis sp.]|nr:hypothetical protein [Methyloversatilis sp.]